MPRIDRASRPVRCACCGASVLPGMMAVGWQVQVHPTGAPDDNGDRWPVVMDLLCYEALIHGLMEEWRGLSPNARRTARMTGELPPSLATIKATVAKYREEAAKKQGDNPFNGVTFTTDPDIPGDCIGMKRADGTVQLFRLRGEQAIPVVKCATCNGTGQKPGTWTGRSCDVCGGSKVQEIAAHPPQAVPRGGPGAELLTAAGVQLDKIGDLHELPRAIGEPDDRYRLRLRNEIAGRAAVGGFRPEATDDNRATKPDPEYEGIGEPNVIRHKPSGIYFERVSNPGGLRAGGEGVSFGAVTGRTVRELRLTREIDGGLWLALTQDHAAGYELARMRRDPKPGVSDDTKLIEAAGTTYEALRSEHREIRPDDGRGVALHRPGDQIPTVPPPSRRELRAIGAWTGRDYGAWWDLATFGVQLGARWWAKLTGPDPKPRVKCARCEGTGKHPTSATLPCWDCEGRGTVPGECPTPGPCLRRGCDGTCGATTNDNPGAARTTTAHPTPKTEKNTEGNGTETEGRHDDQTSALAYAAQALRGNVSGTTTGRVSSVGSGPSVPTPLPRPALPVQGPGTTGADRGAARGLSFGAARRETNDIPTEGTGEGTASGWAGGSATAAHGRAPTLGDNGGLLAGALAALARSQAEAQEAGLLAALRATIPGCRELAVEPPGVSPLPVLVVTMDHAMRPEAADIVRARVWAFLSARGVTDGPTRLSVVVRGGSALDAAALGGSVDLSEVLPALARRPTGIVVGARVRVNVALWRAMHGEVGPDPKAQGVKLGQLAEAGQRVRMAMAWTPHRRDVLAQGTIVAYDPLTGLATVRHDADPARTIVVWPASWLHPYEVDVEPDPEALPDPTASPEDFRAMRAAKVRH